MVSDRSLSMTTLVLFAVSSLVWIIAAILSIVLVLTLAPRMSVFVVTAMQVIIFIARYGALVTGSIAIFRTNRWQAGTPLLVTTWIITCWYALLFVRDLIFLAILVFATSMGGGSGEAIGYSSLPGRPPV